MTINRNSDTAFKRSLVYELLAHAFAEPSRGIYEFFISGEFLAHIKGSLEYLSSAAGYDDVSTESIESALAELKPVGYDVVTFDELTQAYAAITSSTANYLYECNFQEKAGAFEEMADIAGFYKAFGFDFALDRPDRLSSELEYMRVMSLKEAKALMASHSERAELCVVAQGNFLFSHLGRWVNPLSVMLQGKPFYGALSLFLNDWIRCECDALNVTPHIISYDMAGSFEDAEMVCPGSCDNMEHTKTI